MLDTDRVPNALTFDVEDWHQLVDWKLNGTLPGCSEHVLPQTYDILELLATRNVRATFFVLGLVAERYPQLIRDIRSAGHEIGSHGWSHRLVYRQTPEEFDAETRRAKALLEEILGEPVAGYRAAEFSITTASVWALDLLVAAGFKYDSSIFPIAGSRYGIADAPRGVHRRQTAAGDLIELPLTAIDWGARAFPIGGGGYFRLMPYGITRAGLEAANAEGRPAVAYFHPYEFSGQWLVPRAARPWALLTGGRYLVFHNLNRGVNRRRLVRLLEDFRFVTALEIVQRG